VRKLLFVAALLAALVVQVSAAASIDPARLVLRQADVPTGFRVDRQESKVVTTDQDARDYPELRAKYARWGRVTGYQARFKRRTSTLTSRADVLRNHAGARQMLAWFSHEVTSRSQLYPRPSPAAVGDGGVLYDFKVGKESFAIVVWTHRRVFAVVGADGVAKSLVVALARKQQHRIAAELR
jgi:hypothetical protein